MNTKKARLSRLSSIFVRLISSALLSVSLTSGLLLLWNAPVPTEEILIICLGCCLLFSFLLTNRKTLLIGFPVLLSAIIVLILMTGIQPMISLLSEPGLPTIFALSIPVSLLVSLLSRRRILFAPLIILTGGLFLILVVLKLQLTLLQAFFAGIALVAFAAISALDRWNTATSEQADGWLSLIIFPSALILALLALLLVVNPARLPKSSYLAEKYEYLVDYLSDMMGAPEQRTGFSLTQTGMQPDSDYLGGSVHPNETAYLSISSSDPSILLRGAVYSSYNGHTWINQDPVNRYRLNDTGTLRNVFDSDLPETADLSLESVQISVTHLTDGSASLFVPFRIQSVKPAEYMTLLLYFNDRGEVFSTEDITAGKGYTIEANLPPSDLRILSAWMDEHAGVEDPGYQKALLYYRTLPSSIPPSVYELAQRLTANCTNDAAKVLSIVKYLSSEMAYSTDVQDVPHDRDFVDWFLETKSGYCTYFASATAVLSRAAGVPARYVEGYRLPDHTPKSMPVILTGKESHAWSEVYLQGIGWIPVDALSETTASMTDDPLPTPTPTPTPPPTVPSPPAPTPTSPLVTPSPTHPPVNPPPASLHQLRMLILIIAAVLVFFSALFFLPALLKKWNRKRHCSTPAGQVIYYWKKALRLFRYLKLYPAPGETPLQFAARVDQTVSLKRCSATYIATVLNRCSYTPTAPSPEELSALEQYVQRLERYIQTEKGRGFWFLHEHFRLS